MGATQGRVILSVLEVGEPKWTCMFVCAALALPLQMGCIAVQAAVAGAVNAVLRKQAAAGDSSAAGPRLADCVFVLCRWRDEVARREDESELLPLLTLPSKSRCHGVAVLHMSSCPFLHRILGL